MKTRIGVAITLIVTAGLLTARRAMAGSLDAPAAVTNSGSAMWTLNDIYNVLDTRTTNVAKRTVAFTEPGSGPTDGTMHTLNEIMTLVTNRAPVPKTGQTATYMVGDDGWWSTNNLGVAWTANTRFSAVGSTGEALNQIKDNLTGLIWAHSANLATNTAWSANGAMTWSNAFDFIQSSTGLVNAVNYGGANDWRLPNAKELASLIAFNNNNPALPTGHPFKSVLNAGYWTSTQVVGSGLGNYEWYVDASSGILNTGAKSNLRYVWPVRGGR